MDYLVSTYGNTLKVIKEVETKLTVTITIQHRIVRNRAIIAYFRKPNHTLHYEIINFEYFRPARD